MKRAISSLTWGCGVAGMRPRQNWQPVDGIVLGPGKRQSCYEVRTVRSAVIDGMKKYAAAVRITN
jgi:hypothetical protein